MYIYTYVYLHSHTYFTWAVVSSCEGLGDFLGVPQFALAMEAPDRLHSGASLGAGAQQLREQPQPTTPIRKASSSFQPTCSIMYEYICIHI